VAPGSPFVPSSNPLAPSLPGSTQPDATPAPATPPAPTAAPAAPTGAPAADDAAADPAAALTWPCPRCGADAPMTEDHCPVCGTGFLADAAGMKTVKAPLIGDLTKMNRVQKLLFGIVIAVGITLGIVALLTIASLLS
jgi:nucleoid-associated protein YgaU